MNNSELESFIEYIRNVLKDTINESRALLYSSSNTLKKGAFLIMGLNPGGNPNEINSSILDSLEEFKNENYNAYYQDWNNGKPHRLQ